MILASQANCPGSNPGIRIIINRGRKMVKKQIKIGDRIELIDINDTWTKLTKGSKGTVSKINESQDLIWVDWDNGEKIAILKDVDKYKIIKN